MREHERKRMIDNAVTGVLIASGWALLVIIIAVTLAGCYVVEERPAAQIVPVCEMKTVVLEGNRTIKSPAGTTSMASVLQAPDCGRIGIAIRENR